MLFGYRIRAFAHLFGVLILVSTIHSSHAAEFPTKMVRIVIPFSAGGAPDVILRVIAPHLSEKWKQPVVIENRPGANTNIGTVAVTKSEPDGHTLLFSTDGTFIFNPLIYSSMPYSVSELAPITMVATGPNIFALGTHVPAKTVSEFIQLAKSNPGKINYGSTGPASIQRLQMEYFMALTGIQLTHVPFRGANETTMAMLANQMDATISSSSNILPHIPTGKLRALAITTAERSPQSPDLPTMQEAGVTGYETYSIFAMFAPAKTPAATLQKIHEDLAEIVSRPDIKAIMATRGFEMQGKPAAEFQKIIDTHTEKWRKVISVAKIKED